MGVGWFRQFQEIFFSDLVADSIIEKLKMDPFHSQHCLFHPSVQEECLEMSSPPDYISASWNLFFIFYWIA